MQIKPYDLSQSFKLIPNREKYSLTFWQNNTVLFTSKREAFYFISSLSNFFSETLQVCEMFLQSISVYRYQITPKSKSNKDLYNVFTDNEYQSNSLIRDLKHNKTNQSELYRIVRKFEMLIDYLYQNTEILHKKLKSSITHYLILITKLSQTFQNVLSRPKENYQQNKLTLFNL